MKLKQKLTLEKVKINHQYILKGIEHKKSKMETQVSPALDT